jgi:hypothetical protein
MKMILKTSIICNKIAFHGKQKCINMLSRKEKLSAK